MKYIFYTALFIALFSSCRNNESRSIQTAKDYLHISNHLSTVVPFVIKVSEDSTYLKQLLSNQSDTSFSCASFNYISGDTTSMEGPIEFEIDFYQGCVDNDGIAKAGLVYCILQQPVSNIVAVCQVQFDGFKISNDFFWGGFNLTTKDINKWKVITTDYSIQSVKKQTTLLDTLLFCKVSTNSFNSLDDQFIISSIGLLNQSVEGYSTDLVKIVGCNWFSQGIIELDIEDQTKQIINLGAGDCDNEALLEIGAYDFVVQMN